MPFVNLTEAVIADLRTDLDQLAFVLVHVEPVMKAETIHRIQESLFHSLKEWGGVDDEAINIIADALGVHIAARIAALEEASGNA
jgi:hypothetical protein